MQASVILEQMLVILCLVAVGYYVCKRGMITGEQKQGLSSLVVKVFNPALIIAGVLSNGNGEKNMGYVIMTFFVAAGMFASLILVAQLVNRLGGLPERGRVERILMYIFSNVAFIGIPVVRAVLGAENIIYVAVFILEFNILFYTYGYSLMEEDSSFSMEQFKKILNPGVVASIVALFIFFLQIPVPPVLADTTNALGNAITPLAMMIIGIGLGEQKSLMCVFGNVKLYLFCFVRMLLIPLAGAVVLHFLPIPEILKNVTLIMLAMPIGAMPLLLLSERNWDCSNCSNGIVLSTVFSSFSMPTVVWFYQQIPM